MISLGPSFADWARSADSLLQQSLASPSPFTLAVVFAGGLLTSLGPCSLSLLPVTLAYLAGFEAGDRQLPWQRSLSFACGIVGSLVILGLASGLLGRIYGQIPGLVPVLVAVLALLMGLNLLGLVPMRLPSGPDPDIWRRRLPAPLAPLGAGLAFGLAATPCTTPVLAVLWAGWPKMAGPWWACCCSPPLAPARCCLCCWPVRRRPACPSCSACASSASGCLRSAA